MIFRWDNILYTLLALQMLASCASDDDATGSSESCCVAREMMKITFTIDMGGETMSRSRAETWGDNDYTKKSATVYENTIEQGRLQVLLYSEDGNTFLGELQNVTYVRHAAPDDNIYDVVGSISVAKVNLTNNKLNCKIVVLANYDTPVTNTTQLSDIASNSFAYNAAGMADKTSYIPMYGVKTFRDDEALKLFSGVRTDAKTIYMLRAMAKVRLHCENSDVTLLSATIANHNNIGYTVPQTYNTVDNTENISYLDGTFNPYPDCKAGSVQTFFGTEIETTTDDNGTTTKDYLYIYVPETPSSNVVKITVSYKKDNTTSTRTFDFGYYTDGVVSPLDIVRNHVYTFNLSVKEEVTVKLRYQAMLWDNGSGTVTFD